MLISELMDIFIEKRTEKRQTQYCFLEKNPNPQKKTVFGVLLHGPAIHSTVVNPAI
jgi:hypothetical protein